MANNESSRCERLVNFFRTRGVRFWSVTITAVSVGALFAGSQVARNWGQDVNWYTGFGQWLAASGSFVAAGVALWISVSDHRHNMADRKRTETHQDADLNRQAGLVRVTAEMLGKRQPVGPSISTPSIGIRNRRSDRIFEIEVTKFVHDGQETDLNVAFMNGFTVFPRTQENYYVRDQLPGIALDTDSLLVIPARRPSQHTRRLRGSEIHRFRRQTVGSGHPRCSHPSLVRHLAWSDAAILRP